MTESIADQLRRFNAEREEIANGRFITNETPLRLPPTGVGGDIWPPEPPEPPTDC